MLGAAVGALVGGVGWLAVWWCAHVVGEQSKRREAAEEQRRLLVRLPPCPACGGVRLLQYISLVSVVWLTGGDERQRAEVRVQHEACGGASGKCATTHPRCHASHCCGVRTLLTRTRMI